MEKPAPARATVCVAPGVPPELSVTVRVAARVPPADGMKVTVIVQLKPAASVLAVGQSSVSLKSLESVPAIAMPAIVSGPPVFESVTLFAALALPTGSVPKSRLGGAIVAIGGETRNPYAVMLPISGDDWKRVLTEVASWPSVA